MDAAARQLLLLEAGLVSFLVASVFGSLPYLPHLMLHVALLYALSILYRQELTGKISPVGGQGRTRGPGRRSAQMADGRLASGPMAGHPKRGLA